MTRGVFDPVAKCRADDDDGWRVGEDGTIYHIPAVIINSRSPAQMEARRKMKEDGEKYYMAVKRLLWSHLG